MGIKTISLNQIEYYFVALASSTEVTNISQGAAGLGPTESAFDATFIEHNAFGSITITDSYFAPFATCDFILNVPNNGPETQNDFYFRANNKNRFGLSLARKDIIKDPPTNIVSLKEFERANLLNFNGIIGTSTTIGSLNGPYNLQIFECEDIVKCRLEEIKIAQIIPAVDNSISVGENISNILLRVIDPASVDEQSFKACAEKFPISYIYPKDWSAYDAIMFLLPFCISKVGGLDAPFYLNFDRKRYQFRLESPMSSIMEFKVSEKFNIGEYGAGASTQSGGPEPQSVTKDTNTNFYLVGNDISSYTFSEASFNKSNSNYVNIAITNTTDPTSVSIMSYVRLTEESSKFQNQILQPIANKYQKGVRLNIPFDISKIGEDASVNYTMFKGPFSMDVLEKLARTNMYNNFLFENMALSITVPGQVYRQPGYFIEIGRNTAGGQFDRKLLGHWFITEVKHVIDSKGLYTNIITCTKPFVSN